MSLLRSSVTKFHKAAVGVVCIGLVCLSAMLVGIFAVGGCDAGLPAAALCAAISAAAVCAVAVKGRVLAYAVGEGGRLRAALSLLVALVFAYAVIEHFFAACFSGLATGGEGPRAAAQLYALLPFAPGVKGMALKLATGGAAAFGAVAAFFAAMALFRFFAGALNGVWAAYIARRGGRLQRLARYIAARPEVFIFVALLAVFITGPKLKLMPWGSAWYVLDYTVGFSSRFLLGSIINLLFGPYIYDRQVYAFAVVTLLADMALVAYIIGRAIRAGDKTIRRAIVVLAVIYLAGPFSPTYLWNGENIGRLDTWLFLCSLLAVMAYINVKNRQLAYLLMGVLSVLAVFIHQVYVFIFFPLLFALLCRDIFRYDRLDKKALRAGIIICAATAAAFLLNQFVSVLAFSTADEMIAYLRGKTDLSLLVQALIFEYYSPLSELVAYALDWYREGNPFGYTITTLLLLSPWLYAMGRAAKAGRQVAGQMRKSILHGPEAYILASALFFLPAFAITIDWGRWFGAMFSSVIFIVCAFVVKGNKPCFAALQSMNSHITKSPDIYVFAIALFLFLEDFQSMTFILQARQLFVFAANFVGSIAGLFA